MLSKSYFRILRLNLKSHKTNLLVTLISKKKKKGFLSYILSLRNTGCKEAETQQSGKIQCFYRKRKSCHYQYQKRLGLFLLQAPFSNNEVIYLSKSAIDLAKQLYLSKFFSQFFIGPGKLKFDYKHYSDSQGPTNSVPLLPISYCLSDSTSYQSALTHSAPGTLASLTGPLQWLFSLPGALMTQILNNLLTEASPTSIFNCNSLPLYPLSPYMLYFCP